MAVLKSMCFNILKHAGSVQLCSIHWNNLVAKWDVCVSVPLKDMIQTLFLLVGCSSFVMGSRSVLSVSVAVIIYLSESLQDSPVNLLRFSPSTKVEQLKDGHSDESWSQKSQNSTATWSLLLLNRNSFYLLYNK